LIRLVVGELRDKVQNSLDEARMLILGAQVLVGFQYQGVFQPGFDRLPTGLQQLRLVSLSLMLLTLGLLLAPGAYHQIVQRGHDSSRVTSFSNVVAGLALGPFALSLGIDVFLAVGVVLPSTLAAAAGGLATLFALSFWFGLEWFMRRHNPQPTPEQEMDERTDLGTRIKQVLTEARVVLPGSQALLGFGFAAVLTDGFQQLPKQSQYVHLASLLLITVSIVLLMAPAAFHRIVEGGEDTPRVHAFASAMVIGAMVPLALGIAGDFYIVLAKVLKSEAIAVLLAGVLLCFFFGLWFGVTGAVRARLVSPVAR
jgi:Family of unknown function (DUF6328)